MSNRIFISVFAALFLNCNKANAQTIPPSGGELTYEYIGSTAIPYQYAVTLIIYKTADTAVRVPLSGVVSSSCFSSQALSLRPFIPNNHTAASHGGVPFGAGVNCGDTLNSDSLQLFAYYYRDTVILPGTCGDFEFSYTKCCRSSFISNIFQPHSSKLFLGAFLNNIFGPNSSPSFMSEPRYLFCKNQSVQFSMAAIEPDGDSLNFGSFPAHDSSGRVVNYTAGRSAHDPIPSATVYSINGFNPTTAGVYTTVLQVQEHRYIPTLGSYIKVGAVIREINVVVRDTCPNYLYSSYDGGLIRKDTIHGVSCGDSVISFGTNYFYGDGLSSDGGEFRIIGSDLVLRPVTSAFTITNPALQSDTVWLGLHRKTDTNGVYLLSYKGGGLLNFCGNEYPPDIAYFVVSDCNATKVLEDNFYDSISIYPNPTDNKFTLQTGEYLPERITLIDMQGRELKSIKPISTKSEIDVSEFSSGVYLLKVDVGG